MSTLTEAAENIARAELARMGEPPSSVEYLLANDAVRVDPPKPQEKL